VVEGGERVAPSRQPLTANVLRNKTRRAKARIREENKARVLRAYPNLASDLEWVAEAGKYELHLPVLGGDVNYDDVMSYLDELGYRTKVEREGDGLPFIRISWDAAEDEYEDD
jgi:hypothetical protein